MRPVAAVRSCFAGSRGVAGVAPPDHVGSISYMRSGRSSLSLPRASLLQWVGDGPPREHTCPVRTRSAEGARRGALPARHAVLHVGGDGAEGRARGARPGTQRNPQRRPRLSAGPLGGQSGPGGLGQARRPVRPRHRRCHSHGHQAGSGSPLAAASSSWANCRSTAICARLPARSARRRSWPEPAPGW